MKLSTACGSVTAILILAVTCSSFAQGITLSTNCHVSFATIEAARQILTNPDGVQTGWTINVTNQNERLSAVPILFATTPQYDIRKGGEFFDYLTFKLLVVSNQGGTWAAKLKDGKPRLLDSSEAQGFLEQIGGNTDYIIHPDEILAENFVYLVKGTTNLATPQIVDELKKVLGQTQ